MWNEIAKEILLGVIGLIISGLGAYITYLINKHVKNEDLKTTINSLNDLVKTSVLEIYQVYVEELKDKDIFDKEAQKNALNWCLDSIKANMPSKVKNWLETNFANADDYLKMLIESTIASLKNGGK